MTYLEDLLRLREQQIDALQQKIDEVDAKLEVTQKKLNDYVTD